MLGRAILESSRLNSALCTAAAHRFLAKGELKKDSRACVFQTAWQACMIDPTTNHTVHNHSDLLLLFYCQGRK